MTHSHTTNNIFKRFYIKKQEVKNSKIELKFTSRFFPRYFSSWIRHRSSFVGSFKNIKFFELFSKCYSKIFGSLYSSSEKRVWSCKKISNRNETNVIWNTPFSNMHNQINYVVFIFILMFTHDISRLDIFRWSNLLFG